MIAMQLASIPLHFPLALVHDGRTEGFTWQCALSWLLFLSCCIFGIFMRNYQESGGPSSGGGDDSSNYRMAFLSAPLCNRRPERAPHIGPFVSPLCWRCAGALFAMVICQPLDLRTLPGRMLIALLLLAPAVVDGSGQYFLGRESTNPRRLITGLMAGVAFCMA